MKFKDPLRILPFLLFIHSTTSSYRTVIFNPGNFTWTSSSEEEIKLAELHEVEEVEANPITTKKYTPTWPSIDSRPLPNWYDKAKVGVFIHWGVFSVPSYGNEWFWFNWKSKDKPNPSVVSFMEKNYPPRFTYQDFGREFTAEFYDPSKWADVFHRAGAKYVVLTSKHHEGYTLWPSKYSFGWNSMDVGPKRDLVGDLAGAVRKKGGMKFGLYHSWFEFFNPLWLNDKRNNFTTRTFVESKAYPELQELVENYKPEVIWSDGDWEATPEYWRSRDFLAWLYNDSPVRDSVVVNDRWGKGTECKHGGVMNCQDHYTPGHLLPFKWENAMTIDRGSWGFRRTAGVSDYRTPQELITELVTTISLGGNFLINIGPSKDGMIPAILEERLLQIGQWLGINGDAIYESTPWKMAQNDSLTKGVWYTSKPGKLFAIILEDAWPKNDPPTVVLGSIYPSVVMEIKEIEILGLGKKVVLNWKRNEGPGGGVKVTLPNIPPNVVNKWAWTLVIHLN